MECIILFTERQLKLIIKIRLWIQNERFPLFFLNIQIPTNSSVYPLRDWYSRLWYSRNIKSKNRIRNYVITSACIEMFSRSLFARVSSHNSDCAYLILILCRTDTVFECLNIIFAQWYELYYGYSLIWVEICLYY